MAVGFSVCLGFSCGFSALPLRRRWFWERRANLAEPWSDSLSDKAAWNADPEKRRCKLAAVRSTR
eukprot:1198907-Pyramimonas_sp.AAC.1